MSSPSGETFQVQWVSPSIIREEFNQGLYEERVERRELFRRVDQYDNHLTRKICRSKNRDPRTVEEFTYCTRAQTITYHKLDRTLVCTAFRYIRRNGTLAGSGMVDPKTLYLEDGRVLSMERST